MTTNPATSLTSLNQQIADANALTSGTYTIEITGGFNYGAAITPIDLKSGVSLTIIGQGNTLDSTASVGGFEVLSGQATLENLTVADATALGAAGAAGGGGGAAGLGGGLFVDASANV